ncbi:GNAT family N-acetyltransferase [Stakelama saccharophila]|uniref:GNAT family N-acetyltransferase n=1 Tax=Stakelama saccharophila TaxID=3075605 RepID=A0ABZ0B8A4_9SPHN|nr:GNAT family N-acetyltransferase [Stakelama sp. W311]WNO53341.1 GNAT family N-acetyltransferase [Stakelama sp. W311]
MGDRADILGVDPELFRAWVAARSLSRGVPAPVADHGGWRVDTGSDREHCRYFFAAPDAGLMALGEAIDRPRIFLKLCGDVAALKRLLPPRWRVEATGYFMVGSGAPALPVAIPRGYALDREARGAVSHVRILAPDGALAASGHAAEHGGVFAYDRIVTEEGHRRRGLGRAVMAALGAMRRSPAVPVLVASHAGHALYSALGWTTLRPYSTAEVQEG